MTDACVDSRFANHAAGCKCAEKEAKVRALIPGAAKVCFEGKKRWVPTVNGKEVYCYGHVYDLGHNTYLTRWGALSAAKGQASTGEPNYTEAKNSLI